MVIGFTAISMVLGCTQQASQDRTDFDFLIGQRGSIERIVLGSIYRTNHVEPAQISAFLATLSMSNRVPADMRGKGQFRGWIAFEAKGKELAVVEAYDHGLFQYGKYSFMLRTPLPLMP